ncbi:MAG TPA: hypothetical protein VEB59_16000 [Gemmatimonadales bacterium]|nr:hypothetical protein [Gemmatimonadales bacterium]
MTPSNERALATRRRRLEYSSLTDRLQGMTERIHDVEEHLCSTARRIVGAVEHFAQAAAEARVSLDEIHARLDAGEVRSERSPGHRSGDAGGHKMV